MSRLLQIRSVISLTNSPSFSIDPCEGFNRSMYKFNYEADRYVLLPVVAGYETVVPRFARTGVSNFFGNLREVRTFYNCILQGKGKKSLVTLGRFVTNSTIGIGGLFDPATSFGWRREHEDFDRTLERWGAGTGRYLVLPVLGPNAVRSAGGFAVDGGVRWAIMSGIDPYGGSGARTEIEDDGDGDGGSALPGKLPLLRQRLSVRVLHGPVSLQPGAGAADLQVTEASA